MKKIIYFLLASVIGIGCKKSSESEPVPLISRVTVNGGIAYKFFYNQENQLTTWEFHDYEAFGNPTSSIVDFKYNNSGKLMELSSFSEPGHVPTSRIILEYDDQQRFKSHKSYDLQGANPSEPHSFGVYQYAASGNLGSVTMRDKNDKFLHRYNFTYFPDGPVKQRDMYDETVTGQLRLIGRTIYALPLNVGIKGWEPITVVPLDSDEILRTVRYDGIQRFTYTGGALTKNSGETISGREYNEDGTLKRHVFTRKSIVPAGADVNFNWEFDYIKQ